MSTTITVSDESLTHVALNQGRELGRMMAREYPFAADLRSNSMPWDGGEILTVPWDVDRHSSPTRLQSGYEQYDNSIRATTKPGMVTPAWTVQPIVVSLKDETVYSGPGKILDVVRTRTTNVEEHMTEDIQAVALRGAGASGSWVGRPAYADWNTWNGIDTNTGFVEAVASGTNALHGVSKATYPLATHPGFHPVYRDSGGLAGTNLLNDMYRICIILRMRGQPINSAAYRWYVTEAVAAHLKTALKGQERYNVDQASRTIDGAAAIVQTYHGVGVIPVNDMPTNGALTAASPMSVLLQNWKMVRARMYAKWNWSLLPFKEIPGTANVRAALKLVGGNFEALMPGCLGIVENAEAY